MLAQAAKEPFDNKDWLYKKRTEARLDRERAERRQNRQEETARRKAEQPKRCSSSKSPKLA